MIFLALYLLISGLVLAITHGHDHWVVVPFFCFFVLAVIEQLGGLKNRFQEKLFTRFQPILISAILVVFSWFLWRRPALLYSVYDVQVISGALMGLYYCSWAVFLLSFHPTYFRKFSWLPLLGWTFHLLLAKTEVIRISSYPLIDVYFHLRRGTEIFLSGVNVYLEGYEDLYKGTLGYQPGFLYWPGMLFFFAPFKYFGFDIRSAYLVFDVIGLGALYSIGRSSQLSRALSLLVGVTWLAFPVALYVLEQTWIDQAVIPLIFLSLALLLRKHFAAAGVVAGLALLCKQIAAPFLLVVGLYLLIHRRYRELLRFGVPAATTVLAGLAPFLWSAWREFFTMTFGSHWSGRYRLDAMTIGSFLVHQLNWNPETAFNVTRFLSMPLAISGAAWTFWRHRKSSILIVTSLTLGVFFGMGFFFAKWAFCNYYYLLAGVLWPAWIFRIHKIEQLQMKELK